MAQKIDCALKTFVQQQQRRQQGKFTERKRVLRVLEILFFYNFLPIFYALSIFMKITLLLIFWWANTNLVGQDFSSIFIVIGSHFNSIQFSPRHFSNLENVKRKELTTMLSYIFKKLLTNHVQPWLVLIFLFHFLCSLVNCNFTTTMLLPTCFFVRFLQCKYYGKIFSN